MENERIEAEKPVGTAVYAPVHPAYPAVTGAPATPVLADAPPAHEMDAKTPAPAPTSHTHTPPHASDWRPFGVAWDVIFVIICCFPCFCPC
jgi:hypothetical protein